MSAIAEETRLATRVATRALHVGRKPSSNSAPGRDVIDRSIGTPAGPAIRHSQSIGLVFQLVLFIAACLSLVAVIQQAHQTVQPGTGVNDPPPATFISTD